MEGLEDDRVSWPVVATRDLHRDDWVVALREDRVARPGHPDEVMRRLVLEHPGAAVVLAVDDQERVCCLRQYRHAAGGTLTELPAGLLDVAGEDPRLTAERELREEVQLQATTWRHLLTLNPSAGITTEVQHVYLATGLAFADRGDFALHGEEAEMRTVWVPMDDLVEAVLDQRITEAPMAAAVLAYDALRRRGRL
ncbi:NUDIX domain-containing protein [Nocardioides aurantiacus]|uniref:NUDIX domain-containing protein n=1 Tax=Nocardioides aurantiacus TaxID=86796 RepID=UPI00403F88F7